MDVYDFDETHATELCEIMGRNKSDKGNINIDTSWHNYTTFYYSLFKDLREKPLRIFELGLGTNNLDILPELSTSNSYSITASEPYWITISTLPKRFIASFLHSSCILLLEGSIWSMRTFAGLQTP